MKYLLAISILAIITALSLKPTKMEAIDEQIHESEALHDSAMVLLKQIHDKNDSLLDAYFPVINTAK